MEDFNEFVGNIVISINHLHNGCNGVKCEDCILNDASDFSVEECLCDILFNKTVE
ncbi:hypothetical protein GQ473_03260 [archaeon]|nr:hypothetical protein [archaeon]